MREPVKVKVKWSDSSYEFPGSLQEKPVIGERILGRSGEYGSCIMNEFVIRQIVHAEDCIYLIVDIVSS